VTGRPARSAWVTNRGLVLGAVVTEGARHAAVAVGHDLRVDPLDLDPLVAERRQRLGGRVDGVV
jgi:hypothetical protein